MDAVLLESLLGDDARTREESWRYSKIALRALTQQVFVAVTADATLSPQMLERIDLAFTHGRRIVFVNGRYCERHSDLGKAGSDIVIRRESEQHVAITIAAGNGEPLHLAYVSVAGDSASLWQASTSIDLRGGKAELIEQHIGEDGAGIFGALNLQITLAAQAELHATCWSELAESVSLLRKARCSVGEAALYSVTHAHCGGRLQRIESRIDLAGAHAGCRSRGVFALRGRQHTDIHLDVRHNARDTQSNVFWRGVADQRARGVFHGAITVAAGADGADAQLSNKNLLLSPQAEIDTQPVLEIYADEVKASHGATVGQLDETALFYLRSRGVPVRVARALLISGFCREALDSIPVAELREYLDAMLQARLPQHDGEA
jgi:Fe-S cluster assembly protein SufD